MFKHSCYKSLFMLLTNILYNANTWLICRLTFYAYLISISEAVLYNTCIGHVPNQLHLGYVNDELSRGLNSCALVPLQGCHVDSLVSCRFLDLLDRNGIVMVSTFYVSIIDQNIHDPPTVVSYKKPYHVEDLEIVHWQVRTSNIKHLVL